MSEKTIPNWSIFGTRVVSIELQQYDEGDSVIYNSMLTFFLDDGTEIDETDDPDNGMFITTVTKFASENPYICALRTAESLVNLYPISNDVHVFNDEGDIIAEFTLDEAEDSLNNQTKPVLH